MRRPPFNGSVSDGSGEDFSGGSDTEVVQSDGHMGGDIDDLASLEAKIRVLASCVQSHVVENDADNKLLRDGLVRLLKYVSIIII